MNVLLIDDDRFVVTALEKKINWTSLSITEVFTAYNIHQAQNIIENHSVEICVCDIEMPGGSGLDLLAWVKEQGYNTQFIFLTSYADFGYAQKAIELSSLDYQLKPIDFGKLYQILLKATEKAKHSAVMHKTLANSNHWKNNYQNIVDLFWKDLFRNPLLSKTVMLEKALKAKALPYNCNDLFLPVLFKIYPGTELLHELDRSTIDFSFYNIATETFQETYIFYESFITIEPFEYILIIKNIRLEDVRQPLSESFKKLFTNLQNFLKCELSCCISPEVSIAELSDAISQLRNMRENNLWLMNTPIFLCDYTPQKASYTPPSLNVLNTFLEQKQAFAALQNLENYLTSFSSKKEVTKEFLMHLRLDIEQLVFSYLLRNGIEAHTLFSTEETNTLFSKSLESVSYMMNYLQHIITRAVDYSSFIKEENSVIDTILTYIHQHYAEDITRTMLADMVFLNPDYMARLFKKQTQTSVINYITSYRMQKAKELLQNDSIPVSIVAAKVGYGNYSYFSKLFKDVVGCTPNEYRKTEHRSSNSIE